MDAPQKQQIADRLNQSNNILVTVSNNPSVDQLAACLGLTLALNKMGKHAAAVFSGQVPSTIEFLQPEKTIEKTTDSLRDFIISLDKSKADKLRYKVEDKVVKIFITPYKTSISDKDLEFSQGDFNVDIVVALGVHNQADIDQAITAHGRILHDAVVSTINTTPGGELGSLNWVDGGASSLSEMVMRVLKTMDKKVLDGQMATAFLTGIVAETQRFSNAKTSPQTMSVSAELMAAGANQQLVATKLEPPKPVEKPKEKPAKPAEDSSKPTGPLAEASTSAPSAKADEGALEIEHVDLPPVAAEPVPEVSEAKESDTPQIDIDREGTLRRLEEAGKVAAESKPASTTNPNLTEDSKGRKILQPLSSTPPAMTGALSEPLASPADDLALSQPAQEDVERPSGAPPLSPGGGLTMPPYDTFGGSASGMAAPTFGQPASAPTAGLPSDLGTPFSPTPSAAVPPTEPDHILNARDAVQQAMNSQPVGTPSMPLQPTAALNALPVDLQLRDQPGSNPISPPGGMVVDPVTGSTPSDLPLGGSTTAPPPVPPPMLPPTQ